MAFVDASTAISIKFPGRGLANFVIPQPTMATFLIFINYFIIYLPKIILVRWSLRILNLNPAKFNLPLVLALLIRKPKSPKTFYT
jgi:hypothetical protein